AGERLQGRPHDRRVAVLVIVGAARENEHGRAGQPARNHHAGMAGNPAHGETGQVAVGDADRVSHLVDEAAEAGAEHERGPGRKTAQLLDQPAGCLAHLSVSPAKPSGSTSRMATVSTTPVWSHRWSLASGPANSASRCR